MTWRQTNQINWLTLKPQNSEVPTRITDTSCTVIDHIWVNNPNIVTQAFVIEDLFITDHLMNGIAISTRQETVYRIIHKRKFSSENKGTAG